MRLFITCVFLVVFTVTNGDDLFASLSGLKRNVDYIKKYHVDLFYMGRFTRFHQARLRTLETVVQTAHKLLDLLSDYDYDMNHPMEVLKIVELCHELKGIRNETRRPREFTKAFNNTQLRRHLNSLPNQGDLDGAALGWVRLHYVYRLPLVEIYNGTLDGYTSPPLTTAEIIDAVNMTVSTSGEMKTNMLNITLTMLQVLNETRHKSMAKADKALLLLTMAKIHIKAVCYCAPRYLEIVRELRDLDPGLVALLPTRRCAAIKKTHNCERAFELPRIEAAEERFYNVCRGDKQDTAPLARGYLTPPRARRCVLEHNNHPYLLLQPMKVEILNKRRPFVAIYHDIADDREIAFIKNNSINRLQRGKVTTLKGQLPSTNKITKQTLISEQSAASNLPGLRARLQALTTLHERSFERIQVANYGVAGTYKLHTDFLHAGVMKNYTEDMDRRLVTIILYMTDVEKGGDTVLPSLDLKAKPTKGTALIFYNLFKNGTGNFLAVHASCPILYGDKWIANQWVLRNGQEFAYPCTTEME